MKYVKTQNSFAGGEMAPELYGRTDLEKHETSVAVAENVLLKEQGGLFSRPGMRFLSMRKYNGKAVFLAKFAFSPTEKYVVEFGVGYIRFITSQGYVRKNGAVYEIPSPFTEEQLHLISYDQSGDVMFLAIYGQRPRTLTRNAHDSWQLEVYQNEHGPFGTYEGDKATLTVEDDGRLLMTQLTGYQYSSEDVGEYFKLEKEFEAQSLSFTQSNATTASTLLDKVFLCCGTWQLDTTGSWTGTIKLEQSEDGITWRAYRSYSSTMFTIGGSSTGQNFNSSGEISDKIRFLRINAQTWSEGTAYIQFRVASFTYNLFGHIGEIKTPSSVFVSLDNLPAAGYSATAGKIEYANYTMPVLTSNSAPAGRAFFYEPGYSGLVKNEDETEAEDYKNAYKVMDGTEETYALVPVFQYASGVKIGYEFEAHKLITQITAKVEPPLVGKREMSAWVYSRTAGWKMAGKSTFGPQDPAEQTVYFDGVICDGFAVSFKGTEMEEETAQKTIGVFELSSNPKTVTSSADEMKYYPAAWGKRNGWPAAVTFFQGRLGWFNEYHAELSRIDDYYSFEVSLKVKDDDAISANVKSSGLSSVRAAVGARKLVVLTDGGEFTNSASVVTPANSGFLQQSNLGSARVRPLLVGSRVLFVQLMGGRIYDFVYNYESENYQAEDLCALSPHLFEGRQIVQMDYQSAPQGIVWVVLDNGQLLSLSYNLQHNVMAWTHHKTPGKVEGVCVLPGVKESEVFVAVTREIGSTVEILASQLPLTQREDAFCVDCGKTVTKEQESMLFAGFEHLEDQEVSILADGNVCKPQMVAGGRILLAHPAKKVTAGLPMQYRIVTLPLTAATQSGDYTGTLRPTRMRLRVKASAEGFAGMDGVSTDELVYGEDGKLFTGEVVANLPSANTEHPQVVLQGNKPLPFNLTKLTVEFN